MDLTLRLSTEISIIDDEAARLGTQADPDAKPYEISVQLIGISGAIDDDTWGGSYSANVYTQTSRTADHADICNVTERAVIALADLIGERMRADRD